MKNSTKIPFWGLMLFFTIFFSTKASSQQVNTIVQGDSHIETLTLNWRAALENVRIKHHASKEDFATFKRFKADTLESLKKLLFPYFWNTSNADNSALALAIRNDAERNISALYEKFLITKKHYPSSVAEYATPVNPIAAQTCDPNGCTNINFNEGTLNTWYGYWAQNESGSSFDITGVIGGQLGAVTVACNDSITMAFNECPTSSSYVTDYQITLTSGGNDYLVPTIPRVSPWATGGHSVMLGDSTLIGSGVAILSKTFSVSAASANFSYQYAVFLMNPPTHTYYEQPFFSVIMLDQSGDTIPACGLYSVHADSITFGSGFDSLSYATSCSEPSTTVFYKNWTIVNVPLKNYIGQCVTVIFEASDCSPGAHFGYAYVNADCSPLVITSNRVNICPNSSAILTGTAGEAQYSWTGPANGILTNDTLQNITVDSAGTYTLVTTPIRGETCNDTILYTITRDLIKLTTTVTNATCTGGSATVTAINGSAPYTYAWSTVPAQTTATATGLSAGSYTVTVTDTGGCSPTALVVITQPSPLGITIGTTTNASCGILGSINATASGGTAPYTYKWTPTGETTANATGLVGGTYTLTVTDANGCNTTANAIITQSGMTVTGNSTPASCNLFNGSAGVTASNGIAPYTYLWSPTGGTTDTLTGISAGAYTVVIQDNTGCSSTVTIQVTQPSAVTATISGSKGPSCSGGNNGTATSNATGGTLPYTYSWSTVPVQTTANANGLSAGNYTLTVTDNNGCISSTTVFITQPAAMSVSISGPSNICNGGGTLIATVAGGTTPYTYDWSPSVSTTNTASVSPTVNTTYTLNVTDVNGCTASAVFTVNTSAPDVTFNTDITQGCVPLCVKFNNTSTVSGGTIESSGWSFGNGDTIQATDPICCYKKSGTYTVKLTITTTGGCSATLTKPQLIKVYSLPNAAFTALPNPASIADPTIQFTDQSTGDASVVAWAWYFGDDADSTSSLQNPSHRYQDTGRFCANLIVTDINGCSDTTTNCLIIDPLYTLYIPSGFTPNGNGLNDVFQAKGQYIKSFQMYIFDRWGQQIFYSNNINNGWDGTVKGAAVAQEDIYVYKIIATDTEGKIHSYVGSISLLK